MNPFGCCCQLALKLLMYHSPPPLPPTYTHRCSPTNLELLIYHRSPHPCPYAPTYPAFQLGRVQLCACHLLCYPKSSHHNNSSQFRSYFRVDCQVPHGNSSLIYCLPHLLFGKKVFSQVERGVRDHAICLLPGRGSASDWVTPTP